MTGQGDGAWLDTGAAGEQLGLSREAVRKRIQRGSLKGEKRGNEWYVWVEGAPGQVGPAGETPRDFEQAALVEQLRSENSRLWEEIESRREELRRRDVLVAQQQDSISELAGRVQALSAGPEATGSTQSSDSTSNIDPHEGLDRPWWAFWRS